jgi:hypothetical protein
MLGLDQMNELELIVELHRIAGECERLNQRVSHASQRQRFSKDYQDIATAAQEEQTLLAEMNRLMDCRRAIEGHLMRVRDRLRLLRGNENRFLRRRPQERWFGL